MYVNHEKNSWKAHPPGVAQVEKHVCDDALDLFREMVKIRLQAVDLGCGDSYIGAEGLFGVQYFVNFRSFKGNFFNISLE